MLEEIEKELKEKSVSVEEGVYCIDLYEVFEILDKYKDIDKYKLNTKLILKFIYQTRCEFSVRKFGTPNKKEQLLLHRDELLCQLLVIQQELEQKYNIRKENLDEI